MKFTPDEALSQLCGGKLTFQERVVVHRVDSLALPQTISSRQFGETRPQRFVKSRQIPLKKLTFGDLGSSIDLVNRFQAELGFRLSRFGLSCFMFRVSGFGCNLMGFSVSGFGVSAFGLWGSGFGLSCFAFRDSCFKYNLRIGRRVSGFGFRVPCFLFRVQPNGTYGFGFRVSGFGFHQTRALVGR
jgi:hypothetical protein